MRVYLKKEYFTEKETVLLENGDMRAVAFKYSTGVCAVRVENNRGYFIILPFQGQQIWRAFFDGHDLVMKTKFSEPVPTLEYLQTYGGFLLHCGINAFGVPQADDNHKQHGEIPNAEYKIAYIECGEDYIGVGGRFDFDVSFTKNYSFSPMCKLYNDDTVLKIDIELENRRHYPMDYMYLCHINFHPIDNAQLIYSADYDSEHIKVYKSIGENVPKAQAAKLLEYMERVEKEPEIHNTVGAEGQIYDPEICFNVKYKGDENNRAYTMQYTQDGAYYVSHPVDVLPEAIRWISRTLDEDSMGMVLPSTAEHLGYQNAKRKGQLKYLKPMEKISFRIEAGYLTAERANQVKKHIEDFSKG